MGMADSDVERVVDAVHEILEAQPVPVSQATV
jgi:hypothetical protein